MRFIKKKAREPKELTKFKERIQNGEVNHKDTFEALRDDNFGTFQAIQRILAEEQGFVCAYCLGELLEEKDKNGNTRIKMKVEHFKPKSIYNGKINTLSQTKKLCDKTERKREDLRIDYSNLFAVCLGRSKKEEILYGLPSNEKKDKGDTHCDTPPNGKDDIELCFIPNPAKGKPKNFNLKLRYTGNLSIVSDDTNIDKELKEVLNLNEQHLRQRRKKSLE